MSIVDLRKGDRVDLRDNKNGEVVRVGLGTVWADFSGPHGTVRMSGPSSDFKRHVPSIVKIGEFTLRAGANPGQIRIEAAGGEGGEFDEKKLEQLLRRFWNREF